MKMLRPSSFNLYPTSASRALSTSSSTKLKLAYEWIVDGKVLSDSNEANEKYADRQVVVFLHGLLGNNKVRLFSLDRCEFHP